MAAAVPTMSPQTGILGIFGHPIGHTLSPRIHNAAFRAAGLDLIYVAFDVLPDHLESAVAGVRALGLRGVNITVPHKSAILDLLDELDPLAARVGAVNTVVQDGGRLKGYNTDVSGFRQALRALIPGGAQGLRCVLAGAGGAARAVMAALVEDGAEAVFVHNRTQERASALCADARSWGDTSCEVLSPDRLSTVAHSADLLVNATSLGLEGSVKEFPIPVDTVRSGHVVVDLVYSISSTPWVEGARARGALATDGKEMLVMQAADSFRLWTGATPPVDVMHESVERGEG